MTLDTWSPSCRWACTLTLVFSAACALPRAGTSSEGGIAGPDASADSAVVDSGPICDPHDCNDGDLCTDDLCTATGCEHVANGNSCDDGIFCNGFDHCGDRACQSGSADPCIAPTVCNESRHACLGCNADSDCPADNVPDWTSCDFGGSPCELSGTHARTVTTYSCNLVNHECVQTMTTATEACSRPASDTNGAGCSVGAGAGVCQSGSCCAGCLDGSSCVAGTAAGACGSGGGACASCSGGSPYCVGSACAGCRNAGDCNDVNPCTDDACVGGSCTHTNNTAPCDDGNGCTLGDQCLGGSCRAGAAKDCADTNVCTTDACTPATGVCTHMPNTVSCTTGGVDGVCSAGACCTGCVSAGTCLPGGTPSACGGGGGVCVACAGVLPYCVSAACVECASDANCTSATAAACVSGNCAECANAADCASVPGLPVCNTAASPNTCVGCLGDADCSGGTPKCETGERVCVECLNNGDCSGEMSTCSAGHTCS